VKISIRSNIDRLISFRSNISYSSKTEKVSKHIQVSSHDQPLLLVDHASTAESEPIMGVWGLPMVGVGPPWSWKKALSVFVQKRGQKLRI